MSGPRFVRRREVFCSTAQRTAFRPWLLMCSLFSAAEIGARTRLRHRRSRVAPARAVPPASAGPCAGRAVGLASRSQRAVAGSGPCGLRSRPPADRAAPVAEIGLDLRVAGLAGRMAREVPRPIRGSARGPAGEGLWCGRPRRSRPRPAPVDLSPRRPVRASAEARGIASHAHTARRFKVRRGLKPRDDRWRPAPPPEIRQPGHAGAAGRLTPRGRSGAGSPAWRRAPARRRRGRVRRSRRARASSSR